jgi:ribosomal protein L17
LKETRKDYIVDLFTYEDFIECKLIEVTKNKKDLYAVIVKDDQRNKLYDEINSTFKNKRNNYNRMCKKKLKTKNMKKSSS